MTVPLKAGLSAADFWASAATVKDANQAGQLLAFAAIRDGKNRVEAGGKDRGHGSPDVA